MAHTITLTADEMQMVYFALNDYSLKYMKASRTYGRTASQRDYCHEQAEAVGELQNRVWDIMTEPNINK